MVNPPELGDLPGEGDVTYASEVNEVLIPYTTREDSFHYFEERNYVNDVNQAHTEVLQTYDQTLKAQDTYTYGHDRLSVKDNRSGDTLNYLTNQAGSVTGLTKAGQATAGTSYGVYGQTDQVLDTYAYTGEARDVTGLDYLRARYYDSNSGTFLTADSYPGSQANPLSQNPYSYVENNPVNYTDPSGHKKKSSQPKRQNFVQKVASKANHVVKQVAKVFNPQPKRASQPKVSHSGRRPSQPSKPAPTPTPRPSNTTNPRLQRYYNQTPMPDFGHHSNRRSSLADYTERRIKSSPTYKAPASYYQAFGPQVAHYQAPVHVPRTSYQATQSYSSYAAQSMYSPLHVAQASGQSTYNWGKSTTREAQNIYRNWTKALEETVRHVCNPKTTKANDSSTSIGLINLGGVASWQGTSSVNSNKQTNPIQSNTVKPLSRGNITFVSGLLGAAFGLITGSPGVGNATYGAVNSMLTSAQKGDSGSVTFGKTVAGGFSGALAGLGLQRINGLGKVAKTILGTAIDTGLDTSIAKINGEKVTPQSLTTSFVSNALFNGLGGIFGKSDTIKNSSSKKLNSDNVPSSGSSQKALDGPRAETLRLEEPKVGLTRVGRWMSKEEYKKMLITGKVQMSPNGNRTFVSNPANIEAFQSAPNGSFYIEFDVDKNYIFQAGQENWGQIPAPGSKFDKLLEKRGVPVLDGMPDAYNIEKIGEK